MLAVGDKLPEFILLGIDEKGVEKQFSNKNFLGKNLIIYFYPKDNTPGCTTESCNFNALLPKIKSKANIVGVSADSLASHLKFQKKYGLQFPLLSDANTKFASKMGAFKNKLFAKLLSKGIVRTTFLVDSQGIVKFIWKNVTVSGHDEEVLQQLEKLV
ncbi:thioredoxin-dependent thiol peroxidase [Candidatus Hepatincola sp. Av]